MCCFQDLPMHLWCWIRKTVSKVEKNLEQNNKAKAKLFTLSNFALVGNAENIAAVSLSSIHLFLTLRRSVPLSVFERFQLVWTVKNDATTVVWTRINRCVFDGNEQVWTESQTNTRKFKTPITFLTLKNLKMKLTPLFIK